MLDQMKEIFAVVAAFGMPLLELAMILVAWKAKGYFDWKKSLGVAASFLKVLGRQLDKGEVTEGAAKKLVVEHVKKSRKRKKLPSIIEHKLGEFVMDHFGDRLKKD